MLYAAFIPFGDIVEVVLPRLTSGPTVSTGIPPHRGFAFIQFESDQDALAALDNMHMAEMWGDSVIRCNLARPTKIAVLGGRPLWESLDSAGLEKTEDHIAGVE